MTKKDYVLMAEAFKYNKHAIDIGYRSSTVNGVRQYNDDFINGAKDMLISTIQWTAWKLEEENSRFDIVKFYKACGFEVDSNDFEGQIFIKRQ